MCHVIIMCHHHVYHHVLTTALASPGAGQDPDHVVSQRRLRVPLVSECLDPSHQARQPELGEDVAAHLSLNFSTQSLNDKSSLFDPQSLYVLTLSS